jgi:hypothetical protein
VRALLFVFSDVERVSRAVLTVLAEKFRIAMGALHNIAHYQNVITARPQMSPAAGR